eukprot:549134-Prymnesium_polylepis.1
MQRPCASISLSALRIESPARCRAQAQPSGQLIALDSQQPTRVPLTRPLAAASVWRTALGAPSACAALGLSDAAVQARACPQLSASLASSASRRAITEAIDFSTYLEMTSTSRLTAAPTCVGVEGRSVRMGAEGDESC